ncbi:MAG: AMP-binding enzyme [Candidatus Rokuibacteriota bacterium]
MRPLAFVVPRPGQGVTLPELVRHLSEAGIARFKLPERVELVGELPLSPFGKVSKVALTKRITETLRQEAGR